MASAPRSDSASQRIVLVVAILASFVAFLDGTIINVALPAITREFGGGLPVQQWVVDAYLLTLGAFILLAGSLSDAFGRVRILASGLVGFGVTSLLCAVAPGAEFLIVVRALQGATAALLVPSSLALIISTFTGQAQAKAIGTWTAWTGTAMIVGPLIGGLLVDTVSWRLVFGINVLPIAVTLWLLLRMEKQPARTMRPRVDVVGAVLGAIGLGGPVFALIEQGRFGWSSPVVWVPLVVGVVSFAAFLWWEGRTTDPMMPLSLFGSRNFSAGNIATVFIYGALGFGFFVIAIYLQQVAGWPATLAGIATLPPTLVMLVLSSRIGAWAGRIGPRLFMTIGPIVGGIGFLLMLAVGAEVNYWAQLLPGLVLFGIGLSITVAPLTSAILGAIDESQAGIGSAINNAVARVAGLVAVACAGLVLGTVLDLPGFHRAVVATAIALIIGGVVSFIGIRNPVQAEASVPAA
ncbi:EmrB/QacA subfamily drug resistance transporter [Okibacterium sp. HSC-33S16]|uniref:MFS transporter n=1 Tax=Okibacterium sp. HSC-33S16 TaxID=2910965 RepID=UPI00209E9586|nr:MFS transporter [Okibacterium sp. HSC-33S16]MCP2032845.1 EmrB/QacA subfamily drug resistance transporter [Okibacterium sp. HSC-33S16]